jgi:hypothetical protein
VLSLSMSYAGEDKVADPKEAAGAQEPQPPAPATAPVPAPAPASIWSVGPIDFSGLIDGYYLANFNHPASSYNQLYNFDVKANQFSLNMAKLTMSHDPDPVGFRVDFGFGRAFDIVHGAEQAPDIFRNLEQVYVSLKPPKAKGFEVDFGKFVTSAGAEVIETKDNWNYSRSILFAWAIPYYHFGLRTTIPIGAHFTGGVQVVNGWNNVEDNNSGKTVGFTGALTFKKLTWSHNYYVGPENSGINKGIRQIYDTTLLLTPNDKASFYINFDRGVDKVGAALPQTSVSWTGIAGAAHFQVNSWFALSPRVEYFNDENGFSTGTKQKLKEFTMTAEGKMAEGLLARLEFRRDWSDQRFYDRGATPAASKTMTTIALGIVAFFGPKR